METEATIVDTVQTCNFCGNKIHKGEYALKSKRADVFFCDNKCLVKEAEKI